MRTLPSKEQQDKLRYPEFGGTCGQKLVVPALGLIRPCLYAARHSGTHYYGDYPPPEPDEAL